MDNDPGTNDSDREIPFHLAELLNRARKILTSADCLMDHDKQRRWFVRFAYDGYQAGFPAGMVSEHFGGLAVTLDIDESALIEAREPVNEDAPRKPKANGNDGEIDWGKHGPAIAGYPGDELAGVIVDDFHAYMPQHTYIYAPSREMWPAVSVDARLASMELTSPDGKTKKLKASKWLDQNRSIEQMTWCPGMPMLIRDRLVCEGGWIEHNGVTTFNLYRPPTLILGNAKAADRWLAHVRKVYGDAADHIVRWLAHRVQYPQEKINHALVLGGAQGIGKDSMLEPVKRAIGQWNFPEVSPAQVMGRFNGFLKSVILRVNEARDLGEVDRFGFYDHMKAYTAAPPDVLRVDEKFTREHYVFNVCGVIITTNHKANGIFLPADDRRHFVAWSDLTMNDFTEAYWNGLWAYYEDGGDRDVAAYLAGLDLSGFNAKAPPPKTPAFWNIVDANRAPEDAELADVLDLLGNPDAVTLAKVSAHAAGGFQVWIEERKNRRLMPHRFEDCHYVPVRNQDADDGLWKINKVRQVVYAKTSLTLRDQIAAATALTGKAKEVEA